ncbi:hypothetical protein H1R20_g13232, partial [Candolleomyces eurysporus]
MDKELASMVLIRALPEEYNTFVSLLLLLDKLDKKRVQEAFITEEIQRRRCAADILSSAAAMAVSVAPLKCDFCGHSGHAIATCYAYGNAQKRAQEDAASRASGRRKKPQQQAKQAQDASTTPTVPSGEKEFAGNASTSVSDPVDPSAFVQSHADFRWNADSGCTSHMTAHRHWIRGYRPYRTPVELADGSVIFSVGIGSVVFDPVIDGKGTQSIEMGQVLHVPQLQSNLLSCLYLTRCSGFKIIIDSTFMHFMRDEKLRFRARITPSNAAYIDATTLPAPESAHLVSTRPLDLQLWHEHLCHHNTADIQKLVSGEMATGITRKMHSAPFPSTGHCAAAPLDLIHSDVSGPFKVMLLKRESGVFAAFKLFKALAENQLGRSIKALHDDKGGEYMSNEFNTFCDSNGIVRRHTTRNCPQQNGDTEQANRTINNYAGPV